MVENMKAIADLLDESLDLFEKARDKAPPGTNMMLREIQSDTEDLRTRVGNIIEEQDDG